MRVFPLRGLLVALLLVIGVGVARPARAVDLTVQLDPNTSSQFAQLIGVGVEPLRKAIEDQLRQYFQLYRLGDFLKEYGDGQSFTNRGLGVDYASDFDYFMFGVAGNAAFNANTVFGDRPFNQWYDSRGVNVTIMGGLNLGMIGLDNITLYTNYFLLKHKMGPFEARTNNFGFHLQLQLWKPEGTSLVGKLFRWGGLDITTGVEQEKGVIWLNGVLSATVPLQQVLANATPGSTMKLDATGDISFYTRAVTMPIEVTTNLRILHLLSLYGGLGYDLKVASAIHGYMAATARLTGRVPEGGGREFNLGAGRVEVAHPERLSPGAMRALAGVQLNLFLIKLFVHGNVLFRDPVLVTLGGGVRLAY